jgi:hypothetical protein
VLVKTVGQVRLEPVDLGDELGGDGHERSHRGAHGVGDDGRRLEVVSSQGGVDLDRSLSDAALAAASPQGGGDLGA